MKSNRLIHRLQTLKRRKEKVFCAFLTLGYPNLAATEKLILEFEQIGVDVIELGIPFSDPMADGPTIQYSSEQALKKGASLRQAMQLVRKLRQRGCRVPILCFSYLNPIYAYGIKAFPRDARQCGMDGVIVPDLPPEEETELHRACSKNGLAQVFLVAPTTEPKRAKKIDHYSSGFVYYVSLRGVTGARKKLQTPIEAELRPLRRKIRHSILIGFGISNSQQSARMASLSQGVIVGSAIIEHIRKNPRDLKQTVGFVRGLVRAAKSG